MQWSFSLESLDQVAAQFWEVFKDRQVFAIHGAMGAGKTTLIRALCAAKKVKGKVVSPTFSIINQYETPQGIIYHIDLYRIKDEDELRRAGVEECLYSGAVSLVEWPELAAHILPPGTQHLYIEILSPTLRNIHS